MSDITANVVVSNPRPIFTDSRTFRALANGRIYIGQIDTDPVNPANQIPVYIENEDGTHVQISQPLIVNAAGKIVYNGQLVKIVTVQGHSMSIYDAYGAQIDYIPNVLKYDPDQFRQIIESEEGYTYIGGLLENFEIVFNTVEEMKESVLLKDGMTCKTRGFYSAGDGGGAEYKILTSGAADNYVRIQCHSNLIAHIVIKNNSIDIRQAGARNDGTGPIKSSDGKYLYDKINNSIQRDQTSNGDVWHLDQSKLTYIKAVKDSSTDNGDAIRAAVSVADHVTGEGSYKITGSIKLKDNQRFSAIGILHIYVDYVDPEVTVYTDDVFTNDDHNSGNINISIDGGIIIEGNCRYYTSLEMFDMRSNDRYPNFYPGSAVKFDNVINGVVQVTGCFCQYAVSVSSGINFDIRNCIAIYCNDDGITFSMNNSPLRGLYDSKGSTINRCTSLMNGFGTFSSTGIEIDDTVGFLTVSNCISAGNSAGFDLHFHRNVDSDPTLQRYQHGVVFEDCISFENNCDPSILSQDTTWVHNVGFRTGVSYGNYGVTFSRCHSNGHWNNEFGFTGSSNLEQSRVIMTGCSARNPSSDKLSHYTIKSTVYSKFGVTLIIDNCDIDGGLQIGVRTELGHRTKIVNMSTIRRCTSFVDATFHSSYDSDITSGLTLKDSSFTEHYTAVTDRQGVRTTAGGASITITGMQMKSQTLGNGIAYLYLYGATGARIRVQDNDCQRTGGSAKQGRFVQLLSPSCQVHYHGNTVENFDTAIHWSAATGSVFAQGLNLLVNVTPPATPVIP